MALINCSECNKEISDKAISCPHCGNPINEIQQPTITEEYLCCPKCKSKKLHTEQIGFSGGKALAGAVLAGGIGLLAGTIGSKDLRLTCMKCGNHFMAGEAIIVKSINEGLDLDHSLIELLKQDKLIEAVSIYKKETNARMSDSLDYVKTLAGKNNIELRTTKGCLTITFLFVGIASLIALML